MPLERMDAQVPRNSSTAACSSGPRRRRYASSSASDNSASSALALTRELLLLVRACRVLVRRGGDGVVPIAVECVSLQVGGLERLHLLVGDLDAARVGGGVERGLDTQPGLGGGRRDGLD